MDTETETTTLQKGGWRPTLANHLIVEVGVYLAYAGANAPWISTGLLAYRKQSKIGHMLQDISSRILSHPIRPWKAELDLVARAEVSTYSGALDTEVWLTRRPNAGKSYAAPRSPLIPNDSGLLGGIAAGLLSFSRKSLTAFLEFHSVKPVIHSA